MQTSVPGTSSGSPAASAADRQGTHRTGCWCPSSAPVVRPSCVMSGRRAPRTRNRPFQPGECSHRVVRARNRPYDPPFDPLSGGSMCVRVGRGLQPALTAGIMRAQRLAPGRVAPLPCRAVPSQAGLQQDSAAQVHRLGLDAHGGLEAGPGTEFRGLLPTVDDAGGLGWLVGHRQQESGGRGAPGLGHPADRGGDAAVELAQGGDQGPGQAAAGKGGSTKAVAAERVVDG